MNKGEPVRLGMEEVYYVEKAYISLQKKVLDLIRELIGVAFGFVIYLLVDPVSGHYCWLQSNVNSRMTFSTATSFA